MRTNRRMRRTGFTLVEMLVVIVIIGILAGILLPAANFVRTRAANAAIASDLISSLASGADAYKTDYGDYPPDCSDASLVRRHILKRWPHIDPAELSAVLTLMFDAHRVDHAEAIPLWLGGFSSDHKHPFLGPGGAFVVDSGGTMYANPERNTGLVEFDQGRLTLFDPVVLPGPPQVVGQLSSDGDNDPFPVYLPPRRQEPYVYFDARTYGGPNQPPLPPVRCCYPAGASSPVGYAKPYLSNRPDPSSPYGYQWINKNTYQIIAAGLDGHYGSGAFLSNPLLFPHYPGGQNYLSPAPGDDDNITNFSEGGTLEDRKP